MSAEVLAVAVNYVHTVADGRQLSFGTAFAIDMSRAEKNAILDELADLAARQGAREKRPALLANLRKHRDTLAQFEEDASRAELAWPAARQALVDAIDAAEDEAAHEERVNSLRADITASLTELKGRRADEFNTGYGEWRATARGGEYKPRGHRATNLDRMDAAIKQAEETAGKMLEQAEYDRLVGIEAAKEALSKAEAERQVVVGNYDVSVKRYNQAIAGLEEELAELEKLLEG